MPISGNILISGGSGTLGHAIVRTALQEHWDCQFTIYSRSELRQAEMRAAYPLLRYVLGDVRDYDRLAAAVAGHDLIIHAAAMKRIPEAEAQPQNCYDVNIGGSAAVARAAQAANVEKVIGISTDKACQAITAYGASKLAMEKLFLSQPRTHTRFTLVRYGNVLASNGSVIPLWREQAARGQPLTITDRRCTRFWMTERDAVYQIEQAAAPMAPCVVRVPKMAALNIATMASYIAPGADTVETGLRSCEKLHEDLVNVDEPLIAGPDCFWIGGGANTTTGHRYTSAIAPQLDRAAFLAMLETSEAAHA